MKHVVLLCALICLLSSVWASDQYRPGFPAKKMLPTPAGNNMYTGLTRDYIRHFSFETAPLTILNSYWDYQIGHYFSLPLHVQPSTIQGGSYAAFMAQRGTNTPRRAFFAYLDNDDNLLAVNEISNNTIREGYVSTDIDLPSGKPFFTWHNNIDADGEYEDMFCWDSILEGTNGLISPSQIAINNPIPMTINGTAYNDNDFDWPVVKVGPSPLPDHRRVYVFANNGVSHSTPSNASENIYIAYADFTVAQLEEATTPLTFSYTSIPMLNEWNTNSTAWRRFFNTNVIGQDGKIYVIGYSVGKNADDTDIVEPYLRVLVNSNYGQGAWDSYAYDGDQIVANPDNLIVDSNNVPYENLTITVGQSTNCTAFQDLDGNIHYPILFAVNTPDGYWYPETQYLKDMVFEPESHSMTLHDLYPRGMHPNDESFVLPWDLDEDGVTDTTAAGDLAMYHSWPFPHWDDTIDDSQMMFDFNTIKFSRMNSQGYAVAVWNDSFKARAYNKNPELYPEYQAWANAPEVLVSLYPDPYDLNGEGAHWSAPISLNSVETPEFNTQNILPQWASPADYLIPTGSTSSLGTPIQKMGLFFYDDDVWGSQSLSDQAGAGRVMYAAIRMGEYVPNNDPVAVVPVSNLRNYPNPFNPKTTLKFEVQTPAKVTLEVFNIRGQKVTTLDQGLKASGSHQVEWNGKDDLGKPLASGVYFARLSAGTTTQTHKMVLLK